MGASLKRPAIAALAALTLSGCSPHRGGVQPWVWPGVTRSNTLLFAQSGTRPAQALHYVEVWEAEWFDVPATEPLPGDAHTDHRPLLVDLDHDGRLEIVTSPLDQPPTTILGGEGTVLSGRARNGTDWSRIQSDSVRIVADDGAGWITLPEPNLAASETGPTALRLGQRVVILSILPEPKAPFADHVLECRDTLDGRLIWQYEFGPRPNLMAVADLDSDGSEELLMTTYGEGNGVAADGTLGRDSCYCVALRGDGRLLWRRGFGSHPYIGCTAGVADLDGDGRQDVFVALYAWLSDFGGLAVLDGATGEVRAASPSTLPMSHASAGCADVDGDGRLEVAAAVSGQQAEVLLYRLEANGLKVAARALLGRARDSSEVSECRLHAICDLDGNGRPELVLSRCRKRMIARDPTFYPSTFDSCGLVVLANDLKPRQEIPLSIRCQGVSLGDVIPGGNIELLAVTDRLRLYSTQ